MPIYDFVCHECKLLFDKEYSMKNAPSRSRCPQCKKLSSRDYQEIAVHFKGDCHTNRALIKKAYTNEFELKRLGQTLVDTTKESLDTVRTHSVYTRYMPNDNFKSIYGGRPATPREREERNREAAKIGKTVDTLGSYHKHHERKNEPVKK